MGGSRPNSMIVIVASLVLVGVVTALLYLAFAESLDAVRQPMTTYVPKSDHAVLVHEVYKFIFWLAGGVSPARSPRCSESSAPRARLISAPVRSFNNPQAPADPEASSIPSKASPKAPDGSAAAAQIRRHPPPAQPFPSSLVSSRSPSLVETATPYTVFKTDPRAVAPPGL